MKIKISNPDNAYSSEFDTSLSIVTITDAYTGCTFKADAISQGKTLHGEGEELSVCMRDSGFYLHYELPDGTVRKIDLNQGIVKYRVEGDPPVQMGLREEMASAAKESLEDQREDQREDQWADGMPHVPNEASSLSDRTRADFLKIMGVEPAQSTDADQGPSTSTKEKLMFIPPILRYFKYDHLPAHLQEASKPFGDLAEMVCRLPDNEESRMSLRKLLEAKDAAVRSLVPHRSLSGVNR